MEDRHSKKIQRRVNLSHEVGLTFNLKNKI